MEEFDKLPKGKPFILSGKDITVFKIDRNTKNILIWFRDLQAFVSMPEHMINGFLRRLKTREHILIDKLPKLI